MDVFSFFALRGAEMESSVESEREALSLFDQAGRMGGGRAEISICVACARVRLTAIVR